MSAARSPIATLASHLRVAGYRDAAQNLRSAAERGLPLTRHDRGRRIRVVAEGENLCAYLLPVGGGAPLLLATDVAIAVSPDHGRIVSDTPPRPVTSIRLEPEVVAALSRIGARQDPPVSWRVVLAKMARSQLQVMGLLPREAP